MQVLKKSIFYRWFGIGGCPRKIFAVLESEGILVFDEGMSGAFVTKHVDGPRKRYRHRSEGFLGFLAVTEARILCHTFGKRQINIATTDPRLEYLVFRSEEPNVLSVSFESSVFRDGWQGEITLTFKTEKADDFVRTYKKLGPSRKSVNIE